MSGSDDVRCRATLQIAEIVMSDTPLP